MTICSVRLALLRRGEVHICFRSCFYRVCVCGLPRTLRSSFERFCLSGTDCKSLASRATHPVTVLTLLQLRLADVSELVHLRCLSGDHTLRDLQNLAKLCLPADCILGTLALDLDDCDSWVVWATIVLSVTKITDPSLQCW